MATLTLDSIDRLKRLPVYDDFRPPTGLPKFRKLNLIYGFNGSGKTTLSRVLACAGSGKRHANWSNESDYSITLSDGRCITASSQENALNNNILVFNTDFLDTHFRWNTSEAEPIFYIGKEQKEISEKLDELRGNLTTIEQDLHSSDRDRSVATTRLQDHKRDRARIIRAESRSSSPYDARHLDSDYASHKSSPLHPLAEEELKKHRQILSLSEPLPPIQMVSFDSSLISTIASETESVLMRTTGDFALGALKQHQSMLGWIRAGLDYHKSHELSNCLFCGNDLSDYRMQELSSILNRGFDDLSKSLSDLDNRLRSIVTSLDMIERRIPSPNDISPEHRSNFKDVSELLINSVNSSRSYISNILTIIKDKGDRPNSQMHLPQHIRPSEIQDQINICIDKINMCFMSHNSEFESFSEIQSHSRQIIREHFVEDGFNDFLKLQRDVDRTEQAYRILEDEKSKIASTIKSLELELKKHAPACHIVNKMIEKYLGHSELQIQPKDEGYEIQRAGRSTPAPPSEGEKTAIALCYFLVLLRANGRQLRDLIVIIDDPISSLDSKSMFYACSLIRTLQDAKQLFILTHNYNVMNDMKKWLKGKTESRVISAGKTTEHAKSALFFIETTCDADSGLRQSRLLEMPKYLRDYESEYHFLFYITLRFISSSDFRSEYFFVMPNILRKILEIFLSFKYPSPSGLGNKVEKLASNSEAYDLDPNRITSLERLVNLESHADNLDDLITTSSMTVEELLGVANSTLEVIAKLDPEHFDQMKKICRD